MKTIAVIGLGNIARRHRKNLKSRFPEAVIIAMSASGRLPTQEVDGADSVLANIDELKKAKPEMVIVASPATFHRQHAVALIEAGIPVMIEKPVTASLADANIVAQTARDNDTPTAVGYCLRYLPSAQKMKQ